MPTTNASAEELALIKESIILPLILTVFDRDSKAIASVVKTPAPYVDALTRGMDLITAHGAAVRKELRKRGIKVYEEKLTQYGLTAHYLCRGHHDYMTLQTQRLQVEVQLRMRMYLGEDMSKYVKGESVSGLDTFEWVVDGSLLRGDHIVH